MLHNLDKDTYKVLYGKVLVRPRGIYLDAISLIKALNLIKYTVVKPLPNAGSDAILKQQRSSFERPAYAPLSGLYNLNNYQAVSLEGAGSVFLWRNIYERGKDSQKL